MKILLILLLVAGAAAAVWLNREKVSEQVKLPEIPVVSTLFPAAKAVATPHPAREAQARAASRYPGLKLPNSALNQKFIALYKQAQASNPELLSQPEWPLQLADQAFVSLGGSKRSRSAPEPAAAAPARPRQNVVIYTTSHCPYCKQAKQYFAQHGISYREVDIESSRDGKAEFRKLGGSGVPLIMVGSQKVDGFDANELDRLLL